MNKTYTQDELFQLSRQLGTKLDNIIHHFQLDLNYKSKMWVGKCPIHDGDNSNAFNLYHSGDIIGNWYCRSHQCEKIFKPTIIGLIRGLLSHFNNDWKSFKDSDKIYSFAKTIRFCKNFANNKIDQLDYVEIEKSRFAQTFKLHERNGHLKHSRDYFRNQLKIPAQYYIYRGHSPKILDQYDVGFCNNKTKPFNNRIVIPVFNDDYSYIVGYTARSTFGMCNQCNNYHAPSETCPSKEESWKFSKWLNNKGFNKQDYLYNYWFAKEKIKNSNNVILVEGPSDVWKLVECGIKNVVGIFGTVLTDSQKFILDCSGACSILVIGDNDLPGEKSMNEIIEKCKKLYTVKKFNWKKSGFNQYKDIGEIPIELLQQKIKEELNYVFNNG